MTIKVLFVDDQPILMDSIQVFIQEMHWIECVGIATATGGAVLSSFNEMLSQDLINETH